MVAMESCISSLLVPFSPPLQLIRQCLSLRTILGSEDRGLQYQPTWLSYLYYYYYFYYYCHYHYYYYLLLFHPECYLLFKNTVQPLVPISFLDACVALSWETLQVANPRLVLTFLLLRCLDYFALLFNIPYLHYFYLYILHYPLLLPNLLLLLNNLPPSLLTTNTYSNSCHNN